MSIELLLAIKQTEAEAEQIVKQSVADSRQMVSDAEKQSEKLVEQAVSEALDKSKEIISEAEKAAQEEVKRAMEKVALECDAEKQKAMKNMDRAVQLIVERIVRGHGNC